MLNIYRRRTALLVAAFAVTALTGCAVATNKLRSKEALLSPGKGLIVASLGYAKPEMPVPWSPTPTKIWLVLESLRENTWRPVIVDTSEDGAWSGSAGWAHGEAILQTPSDVRLVVAFPVETGTYRLVERSASLLSGPRDTLTIRPATPPTIQVKEGRITYMGAHLLHYTVGKNMLGMTLPDKGWFTAHDRSEDDLGLLLRLRPELQGVDVDEPFP